jgi:lipopolysaccharide transport system ATP-binding protein
MSGELHVHNLGKSYRQWGSELRRIASWFVPSITPRGEHWVLQDVNFSISAGQAIGILGQNGAGKSTLLKLITGTIQPTKGSIEKRGRVAAILELGMGFSQDLTGRQNAYHSAGLMGYAQAEIEQAMPDIESFAEVGDYFDKPVRTYSSGMQMRVAFGVATAFKPDLLIVDEALSVGDGYFQHKSFDRIRQFRKEGVSIMLVTHSMTDVRALCDRVILLEQGRVIKDGPPDEVVDYYNASLAKKERKNITIEQRRDTNGWVSTRSGTGEARIKSIQLLDVLSNNEINVAQVGQSVELRFEVSIHADIPCLILGFMIRNKEGHLVWGSNTWHMRQIQENLTSGETVIFSVPFTCTLGPGSYSISSALVSSDTHLSDNYEWADNMLIFEVVNLDRDTFVGSNCLDAQFVISRQVKESC